MGMPKEVIVFAAFPQWPSGVRGKGWNLAFKSENSGAGCSVGGIRVDTARSFRRGSHRRRSGCILPPSISTDALRTVHLICCQSLTVSACLTDNMAKGIHQQNWELRANWLDFRELTHW